ncbi:hypothetical protein ABEB36_005048 [Hypothenemus hampei]|uniref:TIL domain-containing protein n=1 Tax=Hypothenemus hampei TaxID=57062 RepID=A0ABD1EXT4_HYPHA
MFARFLTIFVALMVLGFVQAQDSCNGTLCSTTRVCRESNSCVDSCKSEVCPLYLVWGCFCPSGQCTNNAGDCVSRN